MDDSPLSSAQNFGGQQRNLNRTHILGSKTRSILVSLTWLIMPCGCRNGFNLAESNNRVKKMCEELAFEIDKITFSPEEIIGERGKLKSWLKAILSVQTCLVYREETERFLAEQDAAKRAARLAPVKKNSLASPPTAERWQSDLAKNIFQRANAKAQSENSEQPSLF